MNRRVFSSGVLLSVLLWLSACYYDSEELLYPETKCSTALAPTFSADILPLINTRCSSCHAGAFASAGIRLDSYADIVKYVNNGSLVGSITHSSGYSPMPKNAGKMSACEIQKIETWIASGLNNN